MIKRAQLPGLPAPNFRDSALQRWALAVTERMEVREGSRGDPLERVLTLKDVQNTTNATLSGSSSGVASSATLAGLAPIPTGNGGFISLDVNAVAEQLRGTKLYKELQLSINNPARFDLLGTELKTTLLRSLADEASLRGAAVNRTELLINEVSRSVASTVTQLTASVAGATAGIRSTQFAIATETNAIAGDVTQLEARLQVVVDSADLLPVSPTAAYATLAALTSAVPAASADTRKYYRVTSGAGEVLYRSNGTAYSLVGTQGSAKLEQVLLVEADKTEGLSAQYTLKVSAGKAIAGFGIAATDRAGVPESAFIVQADKFALTTPYNFSQENTPTAVSVGQTWYKPSTLVSYRATATGTGGWVVYTPVVPFVVDTTTGSVYIDGSLRVGGSSAPTFTTVGSATTNFNTRNDRNAAAVVAPTIASDGTAIDHTINTDGSADISFEWSWAGTEADIDGFVITAYSATTSAAYTFGTTPAAEQKYVVPADKRALIAYGVAADRYYKASVQAYRVVDPDVNAAGIILSARATPSLAGENPYQPAANVAFAGNVSGTVNSVAVATITTAVTAVNDGTTGLATKMGAAQKNILSGEGGIRTGTIDWDSVGTVASGYGIAITAKGILARNTVGATTFTLDATNGNATFSGALSAATGTFSGDISTTGYIKATGALSDAGNLAAIHAVPSSPSANGLWAYTSGSLAAVFATNDGTGNAIIGASGGTAGAGVYALSTHTGGAALLAYNTQPTGIAIQLVGTGRISGSAIFQDNVTVNGTLNTAAISGASGTFSGTVAANAITVSSTTRVANLNATLLHDKDWTEYCSRIVGNTGTANAAGAGFNITVGAGMSGSYAFTASSNNVVLDVISDARLKKDVLQETLGLAFINALKPVTYRMINGTEMLHHGFIAQDVETVLGKGDDSLTVENAEGIKGLNYTALIGPMAKAIQELTIRITALETP